MKSRLLPLSLAVLSLIGCGLPKSAGFAEVQTLLEDRGIPKVHWKQDSDADRAVEAQVVALLAQPLALRSATELALLSNPKLQAVYERLGVAQADLVQAGLLHNPSLSLGIGLPLGGASASYELEGSLVADFLTLFLIPLRKRFAQIEVASVQAEVADAVLDEVAAVRRAFYTVQAGQQLVEIQRTVLAAAQAATLLRQRQFAAGNISEPELVAETSAYAAAKLELLRAEVALQVARHGLDRELGVWGEQVSWRIESGLQSLPQAEWPLAHVESFAVGHRLDLQAARRRLDSYVAAIAVVRAGVIGGLEAGVAGHQDPDSRVRVLGPSLRLELPIFDQRQATRAKLRAQLRQAERSLDELAIRVRSDVRSARTRLLASRQIVEFFAQTILPLRERELAATQLQYNAMQLGLLPLLAAKSHQVAANREYIESLRDYWLARTDLERAAGGPLPSAAGEDK